MNGRKIQSPHISQLPSFPAGWSNWSNPSEPAQLAPPIPSLAGLGRPSGVPAGPMFPLNVQAGDTPKHRKTRGKPPKWLVSKGKCPGNLYLSITIP